MPHVVFSARSGGMSASGQTTTSYHVFEPNTYHEGIYDKGHYLRQFWDQTVGYARHRTKRLIRKNQIDSTPPVRG